MAISATAHLSSGTATGTGTATYTTASATPPDGSLLVVVIKAWNNAPSSVTGYGVTASQVAYANTGNTYFLTLLLMQLGASPGSGALTINFPSSQVNPPYWNVVAVTGHAPANPIPQAVTGGDNHSGSQGQNTGVTLAAPVDANSRSFYAAYYADSGATVKAGWTNLTSTGTVDHLYVDWDATAFDAACDRSATSSVSAFNVIGFEVAAGASIKTLAALGVG